MTFLWLVAGFLVNGDLLGWWLCPAAVLASCNWNSYTMGPSPHCSAHDALSVVGNCLCSVLLGRAALN
mgnify:CR=1 FL=1